MMAALELGYLLAIGLLVGSIAFFSFVVAPLAVRTLGVESATKLLERIFPRYYTIHVACGVVATAAIGARLLLAEGPRPGTAIAELAVAAAVTAIALYDLVVLLPSVHEAGERMKTVPGRDPKDPIVQAFSRLHRRSILLNAALLFLGLAALSLHAAAGAV